MHAIKTRYVGPSNTKGSRIIATTYPNEGMRSKTIEYDPGLSEDKNHENAALALAKKLGWDKNFVGERFGKECLFVSDDGRLAALKGIVNSMRKASWSGNPWCKPEFQEAVSVIGRSYGYFGSYLGAPTRDSDLEEKK